MLRGTNRSVIEINETGNKYFEKALIFVKPEFYEKPHAYLQSQAVELLRSYQPLPGSAPYTAPKRRKKHRPLAYLLPTVLAAAALWLLLRLVF